MSELRYFTPLAMTTARAFTAPPPSHSML